MLPLLYFTGILNSFFFMFELCLKCLTVKILYNLYVFTKKKQSSKRFLLYLCRVLRFSSFSVSDLLQMFDDFSSKLTHVCLFFGVSFESDEKKGNGIILFIFSLSPTKFCINFKWKAFCFKNVDYSVACHSKNRIQPHKSQDA